MKRGKFEQYGTGNFRKRHRKAEKAARRSRKRASKRTAMKEVS
jgi:hypothetical protein